MSSSSHSVKKSPRKKKRLEVPSCTSTGTTRNKRHGRKAMASGLRSRNYVRQNSDELVSIAPHLVRRPLSISSSTSSTSSSGEGEGSSDGSVIDLTRERVIGNDGDEQRASRRGISHGGPVQSGGPGSGSSGSTSRGKNILIIDSDEDVLEMEMPSTPLHKSQAHTRSRNLKKRSNPSRTDNGSSSSSDLVCCEAQSTPTDSNCSSNTDSNNHSSNSTTSPGGISSRSIIQCPICMETIRQFEKEGRQVMVTRCGHIFCNVCIREAAKAQGKCPTCRKPVTTRGGFHELFIS